MGDPVCTSRATTINGAMATSRGSTLRIARRIERPMISQSTMAAINGATIADGLQSMASTRKTTARA